VQSRFTAGLCQCNQTYGDLLFIQVCIDPTCANQVHSSFVPVQSHLWKSALVTDLSNSVADLLQYRFCMLKVYIDTGPETKGSGLVPVNMTEKPRSCKWLMHSMHPKYLTSQTGTQRCQVDKAANSIALQLRLVPP